MNVEKPFNNSEILFLYEAKMCNPNGDPDDENRPRIDRKTGRNLVTDVRLKRFFRNYIMLKYGEEYIWVSTVQGKHVRAEERLESLSSTMKPDDVLNLCIDARLFGATIPIGKGTRARGESHTYTGPVQFTWGYSLHPVERIESPTITSMFMGREVEEGAERYGTIGKDWRVYYSLLAFYGVVNGARASYTKARKLDVQILDNLLWRSVALDATTRSKIGHWPHLYLRVEYADDFLLGDLRKFISAKYDEEKPIRGFEDIALDFSALANKLGEVNEKESGLIQAVYVYESDECRDKYDVLKLVKDIVGEDKAVQLPHPIEVRKEDLKLS